jgi:peptidoglycan hydrolase CwlO-like protein
MSKRLLLSVLSVCILLPAAQVNAAASLANKQKELSSITGHIQTIQKTLLHSQSQQQNLQQQLKTTDSKIAELNQQTLDLGHQLLAKEDDIEKNFNPAFAFDLSIRPNTFVKSFFKS